MLQLFCGPWIGFDVSVARANQRTRPADDLAAFYKQAGTAGAHRSGEQRSVSLTKHLEQKKRKEVARKPKAPEVADDSSDMMM